MTQSLVAYQLQESRGFGLSAGAPGRRWMDETVQRSAYRCLPLLMANQSGWLLINHQSVRVRWDGGSGVGAVVVEGDGYPLPEGAAGVLSHFGSGIVTWTIPFLFRTPPGYNLLVKGPANFFKDGIAPLEGVVETDWAVASFTMNWKITRPDMWITFDKGDPFCMIVPQRRGELEEFVPEILPVYVDAELMAAIGAWQDSRGAFNREFRIEGSEAQKQQWEKDYFQGKAPGGVAGVGHQTRLHLREFTDRVPR